MKYFLDLEACQYSRKIISIGCVAENGTHIFYSLMRPKHKKVITPFITQLTGLTWKMLENAPTPDEVFCKFLFWVNNFKDAEFYVYGSEDKNFLTNTLNDVSPEIAEKIEKMQIINFASETKKKFKENLALVTLLSYYRNAPVTSQKHNSLEDAKWLMEVYNYVINDTKEYDSTFSEEIKSKYPKPKTEYPKKEKIVYDDGIVLKAYRRGAHNPYVEFKSWDAAACHVERIARRKGKECDKHKVIKENIKQAVKNGNYCYHNLWVLEE